jgi:hypothetical protein
MSTSHRDPNNGEPQRLKQVRTDGVFGTTVVVPFPVLKT